LEGDEHEEKFLKEIGSLGRRNPRRPTVWRGAVAWRAQMASKGGVKGGGGLFATRGGGRWFGEAKLRAVLWI